MDSREKKFIIFYLLVSTFAIFLIGVSITIAQNIYESGAQNLEMSSKWVKIRIVESLQYLSEQQNYFDQLVPVVGDSNIECTFEPTRVNKILTAHQLPLTSLNLGFRDHTMRQLDAYIQNLTELVNSSRKKFPLLILNISPEILTSAMEKSYKSTADEAVIAATSLYKSNLKLQDFTLAEKSNILIKKYLLSGYSATLNSIYVNRVLHQFFLLSFTEVLPLSPSPLPQTDRLNSLWTLDKFNPAPYWNSERFGGFKFNVPAEKDEFKQVLELLQSPETIMKLNRFCQFNFDIEHLNFSSQLLQKQQQIIQKLKNISKQVVLINLPINPLIRISKPDHAKARETLRQLARNENVPIYFLDDEEQFSGSDYLDPFHLTGDALIKLDEFIARLIIKHSN